MNKAIISNVDKMYRINLFIKPQLLPCPPMKVVPPCKGYH